MSLAVSCTECGRRFLGQYALAMHHLAAHPLRAADRRHALFTDLSTSSDHPRCLMVPAVVPRRVLVLAAIGWALIVGLIVAIGVLS